MKLWATVAGVLSTLGILIGMAWMIHAAGERAGFSNGQEKGYESGQKAGYDSGLIAGDKAGYTRGVKDAQATADQALKTLIAQQRADTATAVQKATQAILDKERARHESEAQQRALQAYEAAQVASTVADLRRRLRVATRRADAGGANPMSSAPQSPPGPVNSPDSARLLRATLDRLADETESVEFESGRYRSCHRWVYSDGVRSK